MDIRSGAMTGYGYGGLLAVQQQANASRQRQVERVEAMTAARERQQQQAAVERVLDGEVIDRARDSERRAATTRDYLQGNVYDAEQFLGSQQQRLMRDSSQQDAGLTRLAMNAYQSHRMESINPDANRGGSVDYFI